MCSTAICWVPVCQASLSYQTDHSHMKGLFHIYQALDFGYLAAPVISYKWAALCCLRFLVCWSCQSHCHHLHHGSMDPRHYQIQSDGFGARRILSRHLSGPKDASDSRLKPRYARNPRISRSGSRMMAVSQPWYQALVYGQNCLKWVGQEAETQLCCAKKLCTAWDVKGDNHSWSSWMNNCFCTVRIFASKTYTASTFNLVRSIQCVLGSQTFKQLCQRLLIRLAVTTKHWVTRLVNEKEEVNLIRWG